MVGFWDIAAHSVDHMFFLYFDYLLFFVLVLTASVPDRCIRFTLNLTAILARLLCRFLCMGAFDLNELDILQSLH